MYVQSTLTLSQSRTGFSKFRVQKSGKDNVRFASQIRHFTVKIHKPKYYGKF